MSKILIVLFIILTICACSVVRTKIQTKMISRKLGGEPQYNNDQIVIPFEIQRKHLIRIDTKFNNNPVNCVFDTGGMTFLDIELAQSMNAELEDCSEEGVSFLKVDTLSVGKAIVEDFNAIVIPLKKMTKAEGMIGSSFARFFQTTINYQNKTIAFSKPVKLKTDNKTEHLMKMKILAPYFPSIKVKLDNLVVDGVIDTGLDFSFVLPIEMMESLPIKEKEKCIKAKQIFAKWPFTEKLENYLYQVSELKVGDIVLHNVPVIFAPLPRKNDSQKILIGKNFMENYKTTLNYKHKQVLFTEVETKKRDYNFTAGFDVILINNGFMLHGIWENSSADKCGLQKSDKILKFDNFSPSEITNTEIIERLTNPDYKKIDLTINREGKTIELQIKKENIFDQINS